MVTCWVPNCNSVQFLNPDKTFFPLPRDPQLTETWLALTGKKLEIPLDQVFFCSNHFRKDFLQMVMNKIIGLHDKALPFHHMPQMICRTCLSVIPENGIFCVVSRTIPSSVPTEMKADLVHCHPEPLYQVLTFCIPTLNLESNPLPIVCLKCYQMIWTYFLFKLKSNSIESRVRGSLDPKIYGKTILCRCCPATSATKFFYLSEHQPTGSVLKNIFISNFSVDVVPLRVCLSCWNLLSKLTTFHRKCVLLDEMIQRRIELIHSNSNNSTFSVVFPTVAMEFEQKYKGVVQAAVLATQEPSTSASEQSGLSGVKFSVPTKSTNEVIVIDLSDDIDDRSSVEVKSGMKDVQMESEMLRLLPADEHTAIEEKVNTRLKYRRPKKERIMSYESCHLIIVLLKKYSYLASPDVVPVERAKNNVEMWVKIMKDYHEFGYTDTLETVQSIWAKMKETARTARKSIGPIRYLDYLVNEYLEVTRSSMDSSDNDSSEDDSNSEEHGSPLNDKIKVANSTEQSSSSDLSSNQLSAPKQCAVTSIVDINSSKLNTEYNNSDNTPHIAETVAGKNTIAKQDSDITVEQSKNPETLVPEKQRIINGNPKRKLPARKGARSYKRKTKKPRVFWTVDQKLQLVQEMRKEYNKLIETKQVVSSRPAPWRKILSHIVSKGFDGYDFQKLYNIWSGIRISATFHDKNGQDKVDEQAWDLLQLHTEVLKSLQCEKKEEPAKGEIEEEPAKGEIEEEPAKGEIEEEPPKGEIEEEPVTQQPVKDCERILKVAGTDFVDSHIPQRKRKLTPAVHSQNVNASTVISPTEESVSNNEDKALPPKKMKCSHLTLADKFEILNLLEKEFLRCIERDGCITQSISSTIKQINFKDYSTSTLLALWCKLSNSATHTSKEPSELENKVLNLIKMYRDNRVRKQDKDPPVQEPCRKRGRPSKIDSIKKCDIISIMKSYGKFVFKCERKSAKFWTQVTDAVNAKGHNLTTTEVRSIWHNSQISAKQTLSQKRFGDHEIIEFINEASEISDNSKSDMTADKEEEDCSGKKTTESLSNGPLESQDPVQEAPEVSVDDKTESNSDSDNPISYYDYVSLEDIKNEYGVVVLDKLHLTPIEVIEIEDSDD